MCAFDLALACNLDEQKCIRISMLQLVATSGRRHNFTTYNNHTGPPPPFRDCAHILTGVYRFTRWLQVMQITRSVSEETARAF